MQFHEKEETKDKERVCDYTSLCVTLAHTISGHSVVGVVGCRIIEFGGILLETEEKETSALP